MKHTFIVETGKVDLNGDKLDVSAFKGLPKTVLLTKNFDHTNPLGECRVYEENGVIKAETDVNNIEHFFPAIGGMIEKFHHDENMGVNVIDDFEIVQVSVGMSPNIDPSIKTIGEQENKVNENIHSHNKPFGEKNNCGGFKKV